MNRIFRLVWNDVSGTWVAVAEVSRGRVKRSGRAARRMAGLLAASALTASAFAAPPAPAPNQLPTGGSVAAGTAALRSAPGGAMLNVDQATQRAVINWSTFDIGSAAQVNFNQPGASSVTLNRVLGSDASQIAGRLTAPGQVFLTNPNGILFGKTSTVDVGGLAATTLGIADADFMAGRTTFTRGGAAGSVVNEGALNASLGGYIALLAPEVRNQGVVIARLGTVALAAGDAVSLDFDANSRLAGITVQASAVKALVENRGAVLAPGGLVVLSAHALDRLQGGVVNNSGRIEATGLATKAGRIVLEASDLAENSGSLQADATPGTATGGPAGRIALDAGDIAVSGAVTATSAHGDGGRIDLVASRNVDLSNAVLDVSGGAAGGSVNVQGGATPAELALGVDGPAAVTTSGATRLVAAGRLGLGGRIALTADTLRLLDQTHIDARGATGGGTVQVGGGYQGSGDLPQARRVELAAGASIDASATGRGDGGTVSLWSDIHRADSGTIARGSLRADGGSEGGDGGRIETSGHWLDVSGAQVSAAATHGAAGSWLLDPYNVTISTASASNSVAWAPTGTGSNININDLTGALNNGTSIVATTGTSGSELGDINVNTAITKTAGPDVTLTLRAANSIVVNSAIGSTVGKLNLVLDADNNNGSRDGAGVVILNSNLSTNGGSLAFGTGATLAINGVTTKVGGDVYVGGGSAQTISTAGGAVTVNGEMILANPAGLTINSGGGNVSFTGLVNSGDSYLGVAGTSGSGSWDQAFTAAKGSTAGGAAVGDTYLATITSRLENAVASRAANYSGAWFGAHRDVNNGNGYTWRWVAGPEGLESGGSGRAFFQQTVGGGSGSAVNGQYNNFASGEPNGSGTTGEQVVQFFGTLAQWNDLVSNTTYGGSGQYGVTQYLRETNLAASPLTIGAGAGTVTFGGMVGGSKALASLNVTAGTVAINGGGATTQGLQTYNGNVTLGSAATTLTQTNANTNFTVQAGKSITNATGANASLSIVTTREIILAGGSSIGSTTGALTTVLNADSDASGDGGIWMQNSGTGATISSNGAAITLSGGADPTTGYAQGASGLVNNGVTLDGATLRSNGGNIVIRGRSSVSGGTYFSSENSSSNTNNGVQFHSGSLIDAGSGTISITGVGQGANFSSSNTSNGIESNRSGYTRLLSSSNSGTAISLFGDATPATASVYGWGTFLWGAPTGGILLAATGSAGISLGGNGRSVAGGGGLHLDANTYVLASSGAISLTGVQGAASSYQDVVLNGTVGFAASLQSGWGIASPVTASSSNIAITADSFDVNRVLGGGSFANSAVQSSGTLTFAPRTSGKAITVQTASPGGTPLWINPTSMFGSSGLFKTGFAKVVFGSSTAGSVTLDNYTFDNNTEIDTSGNAVLGNIGIATRTLGVAMTGSGSITDTGNVAVAALSLSGSGSAATLDSIGDAIGTVAASVASLALTNGSALTVGTAGALTGITASGTVAVGTLSGDLTLAQNIASGNTGTSAVVLNAGQSTAAGTATGGNIVRSGTSTISTGSGGRATLMTGSIGGSTGLATLAGSGSGRFRYGSDEATTAYTAALASGIDVVYRERPTLTATATAATKVYDGVAYVGGNGVTVTGYQNGDTAAILGGSLSYGGSAQGATAAGSYGIAPGGLTNALGYGVAFVGGTLAIAQRPVSLTGTRVYDGTAAIAGSVLNVANRVGSDSVSLTGSGTLADKSVGSRAIASFGSLALTGASAANYTVVGGSGSATLTAAPLTVSVPGAATKTYDGTTNVPGAATVGTLAGAAAGETVGTAPLLSYADANAGTGKTVQAGGLHIRDGNGVDVTSNYAVTYVASSNGVVNPAPLTVTANDDARFVSQADNPGFNGVSYSGLVGHQTAGVLGGTVAISRPNAGTDVSAGSYPAALVPSGLTSTNYAITYANGNYTIVPANQLLIKVTNTSAAYGSAPGFNVASASYLDANGSTIVPLTGTASGNTFSYGDGAGGNVTFTLSPQGAVTGTGGQAVVGNYAIADASPVITGSNFSNYTFVGSLAVTRAALTPTASNVSKVYDGTTGMVGVTLGLNGAQTGDVLTVSGTGSFSQKNVGSGLPYSINGLSLGGADANNYYLIGGSSFSGSNGVITPASLSVTGVGAASKVYDTLTAATLTGTPLVNSFAGDSVAVGGIGAGQFADRNVGTGKAVTVAGYTLGGADAGNYTLVQPSGVTASITPASLTVGGTLAALGKVYDATTVATLTGTATVAGLGSDAVGLGGTGVGAFLTKDVQAHKTVTVGGLVLTGADAGNYTLVQPAGLTATITPAVLTVGGTLAAVDKTYDATTVAALTGTPTVTGLGADVVGLGGTGVAAFGSKNAGMNKAVTVGGYALTGADATNYTLVQPTGLMATVAPAPLAVGGNLAAVGKVYDATTVATLTGTPTVTAIGSDAVVIGGTGVGNFADKNVGTGKAVAVSGYALSGADAGNYALVQPTGLTASITPASLAVSGIATAGKVYDATTLATLTGTPTVTAIGSDAVVIGGTGVGNFADKNVGTGKAVAVSGYALSGADAGNYALVMPNGLTATITPASLTFGGHLAAVGKVYDATTVASLTGAPTVTALGGDLVTLGGTGVGAFADKNAGTNKAVVVSGYSLSGADAGNYVLLMPTGFAATITPASLSVGGNLAAASKVYDATTLATLTGAPTVTAIGGDAVTLGGTGLASFADKNVGTGKAVGVSGYSLNGADAGNYTLVQPTGLTASITPASLTVGGNLAALGKVYDATTLATLSGTPTVTAIGGDAVTLGGTGLASFADKNVGTGKAVGVSGYSLNGVDAGNYTLVQPAGLRADITPRALEVTATASDKVYDGGTRAGVTLADNRIAGDLLSIAYGSATFADKNAGNAKTVNVDGISVAGADAANYSTAPSVTTVGDVAKAALRVTATGTAKTYDATTDAVVTLSDNRLTGDALVLNYGSATLADKNAGSGKTVGVFGISVTGADAGNYRFNTEATTTADVARATLTVGATAQPRVFDGTTAASVTLTDNRLTGDRLELTYESAGFADASIGVGKTVSVGGIRIAGGADQANYVLSAGSASATADIRPPTAATQAAAGTAVLPPVLAPVAPVPVVTAPRAGVDLTLPGTVAAAGVATAVPVPPPAALATLPAGTSDVGSGVWVALARPSAAGQSGVVTVSVPKTITASGTGFSFPLPAEVAKVPGSERAQVTLLDGAPLPPWLSFSGATKVFSAANAPAGALPIEVVVHIGRETWTVTVSERDAK